VTLIFTAIDKGRIVQVSDRRLTWPNGEVHDHGANKAVCVGMGHIHFATSYTGLAYIGRVRKEDRTDYWLLDTLGSITRDGEPSIEDICGSLGERAGHALSRLEHLRNKGLTVVMAGYDRENRPFRATVSNMKMGTAPSDVRERFLSEVRRFYPWDPKPDIHVAGAVAAFQAKDRHARALKRIRAKVEKRMRERGAELDELQVAQMLVSLVNAATTHPTFGHLIGRDCLSVEAFPRVPGMLGAVSISLLPPSQAHQDTPFTSHYFSVGASPVLYGPLIADPYLSIMDVEVDLNPKPLDAPPNAPEVTQRP
jgi:hypothetical protein